MLWVATDDGGVRAIRVQTGLVDATCTEVRGDEITEGLVVVTGVERAETSTSSNPFQPATPPGGPRRMGGGF